MSLRTDLADFNISQENVVSFMEGREIQEPIPRGIRFEAWQDMIHCYCGDKSAYAGVINVEQGKFVVLKKIKSI